MNKWLKRMKEQPAHKGKKRGWEAVKLPALKFWLKQTGNVEGENKHREVFLDCENTPSCGPWIKHTLHTAQEVNHGEGVAYVHWYKCSICGHLKKFGFSENDPMKKGE